MRSNIAFNFVAIVVDRKQGSNGGECSRKKKKNLAKKSFF